MPESDDDRPVLKTPLPLENNRFLRQQDLLSYEELLRVVRLAVDMGMSRLRLTGGEPLLRRGILDFIRTLSQKARDLGFSIKLNTVAIRGVNDDEFADFARLALNSPFQVRFIEFMPAGDAGSWSSGRFIESDEIMERLAAVGTLTPIAGRDTTGPARLYRLQSGDRCGEIGFISPISHHFCDRCNRLRLTSEGKLRPCLLRSRETDLRALLRSGADDAAVRHAIRETVLNKPGGHELTSVAAVEKKSHCSGKMSKIGG